MNANLYACGADGLVGTGDDAFLSSTSTDLSGLYLFDNLTPGNYYVEFTKPAGFEFTLKDQGADNTDSDADPATGRSPCVTLAAGESKLTVDAGVYRPASLGDRVWHDLDRDGFQDAGEPGMANVKVNLRDCTGAFIATATTDANGIYGFGGLLPGQYMVEFVNPDASVWTFSPRDAAGNAVDSDADPATGRTVCITLTSGQQDVSWDAGLYQARADIDLKKYVSVAKDKNGNRIWEDANFPIGPIASVCVSSSSSDCIDYVYFKFVVKNTGEVSLENLTLSDDTYNTSGCPALPSSLQPGESYTCIIKVNAEVGQHTQCGDHDG